MNDYIADRLAQAHSDELFEQAAAARQRRLARRERHLGRTGASARGQRRHRERRSEGGAHFAVHPVARLQAWLAAGQL